MRRRFNLPLGLVLLGPLLVVACLAPIWTPYGPAAINLRARLQPPSAAHWFGTDEFGRDVLSRVMAGASASVLIAAVTVAAAIIAGSVLGLLAGCLRGWTDRILGALADTLLAFPGILLALALLVILGSGRLSLMAALGIAYTPAVLRVVRGAALSVSASEFVAASRMMGNGPVYTIFRHVLPNCLPPVTVLATSMLGWVLLAESALSFLGLGLPPPAATWGGMLANSRPFMSSAIWLELAPGLCITLTLLGVNQLGDALRDRLDPRLRAA